MKKIISLFLITAGGFMAFSLVRPVSAAAFTGNNLIDDRVFDNANSMSASQIDAWLNASFPNSCISTNNGFAAADPTGYSPSGGFTYGGAVSAGQVIYDAGQAYGLNPQVLITTLQKEEGLVAGNGPYGCSALAISASVGYGCPDSGSTYTYNGLNPALYYSHGTAVTSVSSTCVNGATKAGFSQQLIRAAWLLKFGEQRSEGNTGWAVIKPGWDNSDDPGTCYSGPMTQGTYKRCSTDSSAVYYDGYLTIDGVSTHMDTGATAALYWYTPHFHGNQVFDDTFQGWFGSLYQIYTWSIVSQYAYTDSSKSTPVDLGKLGPGQRYFIGFSLKNTGNVTWSRDGTTPMDVGTATPRDRASPFCDATWSNPSPSCNRPAPLHEWSVAPGQIGSFEFWVTTPSTPGAYNEIYAPVIESTAWMDSHTVSFPMIVNPTSYDWSMVGQTVFTDDSKRQVVDGSRLVAGQHYYYVINVKNTGNMLWQRGGSTPVALGSGTVNAPDQNSMLCETNWLGCARPTSLHEWSVASGQIGSFEFWIKTPPGGSYATNFTPVVENVTWMNNPAFYFSGTTTTAINSWALINQFTYTDSTKSTPVNMGQLVAGQRYYIGFGLKNTGNTIWHQNTTNPFGAGPANTVQADIVGNYCDTTTWPGGATCKRTAYLHEFTVSPGQVGSFEFWIKAPSSGGSYVDTYAPLIEGVAWLNDHTVSFPSVVQ